MSLAVLAVLADCRWLMLPKCSPKDAPRRRRTGQGRRRAREVAELVGLVMLVVVVVVVGGCSDGDSCW